MALGLGAEGQSLRLSSPRETGWWGSGHDLQNYGQGQATWVLCSQDSPPGQDLRGRLG